MDVTLAQDAAPGIRTDVSEGSRRRVAMAFTIVLNDPQLWLLGALGFCLRGGIVVLTLPMIVLPTPVEARLLLGEYLGTTGLTDRFWTESALISLAAALLALGVLAILARIEAWAFNRLPIVDDEAGHATHPEPGALRLVGVQVLTFVAILLAAAPVARAAVASAHKEIVQPTSNASIYERVFASLGPELVFFFVALAVIETISAVATREVLVSARGTGRDSLGRAIATALAHIVRSPLRTAVTAALGWIVTIALVLPGLGAIFLAWAGVRSTFLTSVSLSDFGEDVAMVLMAVALAAAFVLAMALGGFASALRAALWTVSRLR